MQQEYLEQMEEIKLRIQSVEEIAEGAWNKLE